MQESEFRETVRKVDRLYDLLYADGFAQSIKDQKSDIAQIKEDLHALTKSFAVFTAGRAATCPYRKDTRSERRERILIAGVIFAGASSTAALVTLALRATGIF
jgi:hypothetical protein